PGAPRPAPIGHVRPGRRNRGPGAGRALWRLLAGGGGAHPGGPCPTQERAGIIGRGGPTLPAARVHRRPSDPAPHVPVPTPATEGTRRRWPAERPVSRHPLTCASVSCRTLRP